MIGRLLAAGGLGALLFNLIFPRADDPWDPSSVLAMMAENSLRRQLAFVGATLSVLLISGCLIELAVGTGSAVGRWGAGLVALGATSFTVASALGLAATGPARSWAGGGPAADTDFLIAATLNRADDFAWYVAIAVLWTGIGLVGVSLRNDVARAASTVLATVGFVTGVGVGLPLAIGVEWMGLLMAFGVLATITAIWALVVGLRLGRLAP